MKFLSRKLFVAVGSTAALVYEKQYDAAAAVASAYLASQAAVDFKGAGPVIKAVEKEVAELAPVVEDLPVVKADASVVAVVKDIAAVTAEVAAAPAPAPSLTPDEQAALVAMALKLSPASVEPEVAKVAAAIVEA